MTHAAIRLLPGSLYDRLLASYSPVAWWKLADASGSATAADSSGNGYGGTVSGGVTFGEVGPIPGTPSDTGALFDGSTGYVSSTLPALTGALTLIAWAKLASATPAEYGGIAGFRLGKGANPTAPATGEFYFLQLQGTANLECRFQNLAGTNYAFENVPLSVGTWQMLAMTYDGSSTLTLYIDGSQYGTVAASGALGALSDAFGIGANWNSIQGAFNFFGGEVAQTAVFTRALGASQIAELYAAASA